MLVKDFIDFIASFLTTENNKIYSRSNILFFLNDALKELSYELDLFLEEKAFFIKNKEDCYIKNDYVKVLSASLMNKPLKILSYNKYINNKEEQSKETLFVSPTNLFLCSNVYKQELKIIVSVVKQVKKEDDELCIPRLVENLIYYYVMFRAKEKLLSPSSLETSAYFKKMYLEELKKCKNELRMNTKDIYYTRYKRV